MKKITLLLMSLLFCFIGAYSQLGTTGHFPTNTLDYTPTGYSASTILMRQGGSVTNAGNTYISNIDNTDLFVNFTYDTSGKTVYLVYTNNGSSPSKSNGTSITCSFSYYSNPNRVFVGQIPMSANTAGSEIRYVFYISNSDLASAWGRIAGDGYQTSWTEGNSYFNYNVWSASNIASGNWSSTSTWKSGSVPNSETSMVIINSSNAITLDQNVSVSKLIIRGAFTASDASSRTLTISNSTSGSATTLSNSGTWANGTGGSTVIFTGAPSSGDAIHTISGTIAFQNLTVNKTSGSSNVGASFGANSSLTGTLEIGSGGFISTNPPTGFYGTGAILKFNQGVGATYQVNTGDKTWSTTEIPQNITITSGTVQVNENRTATGSLIIETGATLTLSAAKQLSINTGLTNNGSLNLLSDATGTATILTPASITSGVGASYKVQQYLSTARNWYSASPVTGATVPTGKTYYKYDETGSNTGFSAPATAYWVAVPEATTLSPLGVGYVIQSGAAATTVEFNGSALNNGTVTTPTLSRTTNATKLGFNLVGNPYPSFVNARTAVNNATNLEKTIWYRTQNTSFAYIFDTYNTTSGLGTNNNLTGAVVGNVPPMQAFWVRVSSGSATLSFDNTLRLHKTASEKPFMVPEAKNTAQQVLRLNISNGTNSDEAVVLVNANASDEYDNYDSPKMTNDEVTIPEIYTLAGTEQVAINGLNSCADKTLTLGFVPGQASTFSITASEISNFDTNTKIILRDNQNALTPEKELSAGTTYTFTSDATATASRFSIIFRTNSIATTVDNETSNATSVYKNLNGQIVVNYAQQLNESSIATVYNAVGQKMEEKMLINPTTVLNKSYNSGVYFVNLRVNGKSFTKKIVIN